MKYVPGVIYQLNSLLQRGLDVLFHRYVPPCFYFESVAEVYFLNSAPILPVRPSVPWDIDAGAAAAPLEIGFYPIFSGAERHAAAESSVSRA